MRALVLLLLVCGSCGTTPTSSSPVLLWQTDAPGCTPRRPVVVPMGKPDESTHTEGDTLTVLYVRIDDEFIAELVKRQIADERMRDRFAPQPESAPPEQTTMSPAMIAMLGAAADGASTYRFLKQGRQGEDNVMFSGLRNKPMPTGLAVAGLGIGSALAGKLLTRKLPQGLIDALVANLGARQAVLAGEGFDDGTGEGGFRAASRLLKVAPSRRQ